MLRSVRGQALVRLHGRPVGDLTFRSGGSEFAYTDDLLDPDHEILGQMFEESPRASFRRPVGLPAWFANLLPEKGSGLRRYYAARFGEREIDDARLLLSLGADLPGAVTVEAVDVPAEGVLVDAAEARVDEGGRLHLSALAGAQPKMSVVRDGERLTLPARGEEGTWIAKFPNPTWSGLVENEFLMMTLGRAIGLDVPPVALVRAAGIPDIFEAHLGPDTAVFTVERFDRSDGRRVHIEDLAQVTGRHPYDRDRDTTYDRIGLYLRSLLGDDGVEDYVRRLALMVLIGNGDAHLKNWSLIYPDGRTATLSPVYDMVSTTAYRNLGQELTFPLGGEKRSDRVGVAEFANLAETTGMAGAQVTDLARETAAAVRSAWPQVRDEELAPALVAHLDRRLEAHPLR